MKKHTFAILICLLSLSTSFVHAQQKNSSKPIPKPKKIDLEKAPKSKTANKISEKKAIERVVSEEAPPPPVLEEVESVIISSEVVEISSDEIPAPQTERAVIARETPEANQSPKNNYGSPTDCRVIGNEYEGLRAAEREGKLCFVDAKKNLIIPAIYDYSEYEARYAAFRNGVCTLKKGGLYGLIDKYNNEIIPFLYSRVDQSNTNGYVVILDNRYGFYDSFGNQTIPNIYESITPVYYSETNMLIAKRYGKVGVIDLYGNVILPFNYDKIERYVQSEKAFIVSQGGLEKLIRTDQTSIFKGQYEQISEHGNNHFLVKKDGKMGVINRSEQVIVPFEYTQIQTGSTKESDYSTVQTFITKVNDKWGVYDVFLKKTIIENKYDEILLIGRKYYSAKLNDKWGLFKDENLILPIEYDKIENKYSNALGVRKGNKNGVYSIVKDQFILEPIYETIDYNYNYGYASCIDNKCGLFDMSGVQTLPMEYQRIIIPEDFYYNKSILVMQNNKVGISSPSGQIEVPIENDDIVFLKNGFIKALKDNKWAVIHTKLKNIRTPYQYRSATLLPEVNEFILDGKKYKYIKNKMVEIPLR